MPAQVPQAELAAIYDLYSALARDLDPENGFGGKLLYAGELTPDGCRLVRAANIAGAASLSATADPAAQKQAIREGVIDFLVTSLDEALRILKNEIRKRQAVAVGVAVSSHQIVRAMGERGVLPDLLPPSAGDDSALEQFRAQGARNVAVQPLSGDQVFLVVEHPPAGFEDRALASIPPHDHANRRWLRLSPRYLGPQARRIRSLACAPDAAKELTTNL